MISHKIRVPNCYIKGFVTLLQLDLTVQRDPSPHSLVDPPRTPDERQFVLVDLDKACDSMDRSPGVGPVALAPLTNTNPPSLAEKACRPAASTPYPSTGITPSHEMLWGLARLPISPQSISIVCDSLQEGVH